MSQRGVFASSFIVCANWHTPQTAERDSTSVEVRAQDLELQLDLAHSVGTSVWSFGGSTLLTGVSPGLMTVSRSRSGRTLANSPQPMEVEEGGPTQQVAQSPT